jgi:hypothetical protein
MISQWTGSYINANVESIVDPNNKSGLLKLDLFKYHIYNLYKCLTDSDSGWIPVNSCKYVNNSFAVSAGGWDDVSQIKFPLSTAVMGSSNIEDLLNNTTNGIRRKTNRAYEPEQHSWILLKKKNSSNFDKGSTVYMIIDCRHPLPPHLSNSSLLAAAGAPLTYINGTPAGAAAIGPSVTFNYDYGPIGGKGAQVYAYGIEQDLSYFSGVTKQDLLADIDPKSDRNKYGHDLTARVVALVDLVYYIVPPNNQDSINALEARDVSTANYSSATTKVRPTILGPSADKFSWYTTWGFDYITAIDPSKETAQLKTEINLANFKVNQKADPAGSGLTDNINEYNFHYHHDNSGSFIYQITLAGTKTFRSTCGLVKISGGSANEYTNYTSVTLNANPLHLSGSETYSSSSLTVNGYGSSLYFNKDKNLKDKGWLTLTAAKKAEISAGLVSNFYNTSFRNYNFSDGKTSVLFGIDSSNTYGKASTLPSFVPIRPIDASFYKINGVANVASSSFGDYPFNPVGAEGNDTVPVKQEYAGATSPASLFDFSDQSSLIRTSYRYPTNVITFELNNLAVKGYVKTFYKYVLHDGSKKYITDFSVATADCFSFQKFTTTDKITTLKPNSGVDLATYNQQIAILNDNTFDFGEAIITNKTNSSTFPLLTTAVMLTASVDPTSDINKFLQKPNLSYSETVEMFADKTIVKSKDIAGINSKKETRFQFPASSLSEKAAASGKYVNYSDEYLTGFMPKYDDTTKITFKDYFSFLVGANFDSSQGGKGPKVDVAAFKGPNGGTFPVSIAKLLTAIVRIRTENNTTVGYWSDNAGIGKSAKSGGAFTCPYLISYDSLRNSEEFHRWYTDAYFSHPAGKPGTRNSREQTRDTAWFRVVWSTMRAMREKGNDLTISDIIDAINDTYAKVTPSLPKPALVNSFITALQAISSCELDAHSYLPPNFDNTKTSTPTEYNAQFITINKTAGKSMFEQGISVSDLATALLRATNLNSDISFCDFIDFSPAAIAAAEPALANMQKNSETFCKALQYRTKNSGGIITAFPLPGAGNYIFNNTSANLLSDSWVQKYIFADVPLEYLLSYTPDGLVDCLWGNTNRIAVKGNFFDSVYVNPATQYLSWEREGLYAQSVFKTTRISSNFQTSKQLPLTALLYSTLSDSNNIDDFGIYGLAKTPTVVNSGVQNKALAGPDYNSRYSELPIFLASLDEFNILKGYISGITWGPIGVNNGDTISAGTNKPGYSKKIFFSGWWMPWDSNVKVAW